MFFIYLVLFIVSVVVAYIEYNRLRLSIKYKHVPGVTEIPVFGSKYSLKPNKIQDYRVIFQTLCFAPITKIFFASQMVFLVSEPNALQQILTNNTFNERPDWFKFFRLKYGLINARHSEWKPIRKAINPAFSQRMSISFIPQFVKHFDQFSDKLEPYIGKGEFDINEISIDIGINLILETNFMHDHFQDERMDPQLFEDYEDNVCTRVFKAYLHPDFLYNNSQLGKEDRVIIDKMRGIFRSVIELRRQNLLKGSSEPVDESKHYFVDKIMKYQKDSLKDDDDISIDNAITVFMAGYETSAMTISYVVLMLAIFPEIDAKIEAEIFENYKPGDEIDYDLLKRFTYLDMVIKETLRIFPVAPLTARENMEDVYIDGIGHMEKGSMVMCNFYNLHHSKDIWGEDADKFNPDNWLPEKVAQRHPYSFMPFSAGPRMCVGYQYAQINVKLGLLILLSRFKFTSDLKLEDLTYKFSVTLKLLNGHMVKATHRKYNNNQEM